ncbi:unnamed protein product [Amoebophrya sp. A25]|nr:unnamed protein product [Amoebophrya sp. A25]|eukprot:GSA25T00010432001.1
MSAAELVGTQALWAHFATLAARVSDDREQRLRNFCGFIQYSTREEFFSSTPSAKKLVETIVLNPNPRSYIGLPTASITRGEISFLIKHASRTGADPAEQQVGSATVCSKHPGSKLFDSRGILVAEGPESVVQSVLQHWTPKTVFEMGVIVRDCAKGFANYEFLESALRQGRNEGRSGAEDETALPDDPGATWMMSEGEDYDYREVLINVAEILRSIEARWSEHNTPKGQNHQGYKHDTSPPPVPPSEPLNLDVEVNTRTTRVSEVVPEMIAALRSALVEEDGVEKDLQQGSRARTWVTKESGPSSGSSGTSTQEEEEEKARPLSLSYNRRTYTFNKERAAAGTIVEDVAHPSTSSPSSSTSQGALPLEVAEGAALPQTKEALAVVSSFPNDLTCPERYNLLYSVVQLSDNYASLLKVVTRLAFDSDMSWTDRQCCASTIMPKVGPEATCEKSWQTGSRIAFGDRLHWGGLRDEATLREVKEFCCSPRGLGADMRGDIEALAWVKRRKDCRGTLQNELPGGLGVVSPEKVFRKCQKLISFGVAVVEEIGRRRTEFWRIFREHRGDQREYYWMGHYASQSFRRNYLMYLKGEDCNSAIGVKRHLAKSEELVLRSTSAMGRGAEWQCKLWVPSPYAEKAAEMKDDEETDDGRQAALGGDSASPGPGERLVGIMKQEPDVAEDSSTEDEVVTVPRLPWKRRTSIWKCYEDEETIHRVKEDFYSVATWTAATTWLDLVRGGSECIKRFCRQEPLPHACSTNAVKDVITTRTTSTGLATGIEDRASTLVAKLGVTQPSEEDTASSLAEKKERGLNIFRETGCADPVVGDRLALNRETTAILDAWKGAVNEIHPMALSAADAMMENDIGQVEKRVAADEDGDQSKVDKNEATPATPSPHTRISTSSSSSRSSSSSFLDFFIHNFGGWNSSADDHVEGELWEDTAFWSDYIIA